jgi:hypothetical protein
MRKKVTTQPSLVESRHSNMDAGNPSYRANELGTLCVPKSR